MSVLNPIKELFETFKNDGSRVLIRFVAIGAIASLIFFDDFSLPFLDKNLQILAGILGTFFGTLIGIEVVFVGVIGMPQRLATGKTPYDKNRIMPYVYLLAIISTIVILAVSRDLLRLTGMIGLVLFVFFDVIEQQRRQSAKDAKP